MTVCVSCDISGGGIGLHFRNQEIFLYVLEPVNTTRKLNLSHRSSTVKLYSTLPSASLLQQ
jgi:hypothetical protein